VTGRLTVAGLGPGRGDWCIPQVLDRLTEATDVVGYRPYLDQIPVPITARRYGSGNRVETDRAALALDLAEAGGAVVVVSSGDPGVFAMATAIVECLDAAPDRWTGVAVEVLPGISAAHALASRVGAPLGHDFCVVSLSDVLKPWELIERRIDAAAGADFVLAFYNPTSRHRPWQLGRALEIVATHRAPTTSVVIGRNVARDSETVRVVDLAAVDPQEIDMSTILIVGSSMTRVVRGRGLATSVYTPRQHP